MIRVNTPPTAVPVERNVVRSSGRRRRQRVLRVFAAIALATAGVAAANGQDAGERTIVERWRDTLLYGIDSEIEPVLTQIRQAGETSLDEEIVSRFSESTNNDLREAIVEHYAELESPTLAEEVRELLLDEDELDDDLLRVASAYLSRTVEDRSPELLARYAEVAEGRDLLAASVAIDAIGRDGSPAAVSLLLDLYSELSSTDLRSAVLRALGETGSAEAVPLLSTIATDEFEESALRQYAAQSLGIIGEDESLELLRNLLASDDSILRAFATAALGYYNAAETGGTLEAALRDSFWRVRVAALEGLAEQRHAEAIPAVAYKARRDPERPVRQEAIRTLAALETPEGFDILREIASNERASEVDRILAIEELALRDPDASREVLAEIVQSEWDREGSRVLDAIGRTTSQSPQATLSPIYIKFLEHPNFVIRIYGIRGIGGAGIGTQAEQLRRIARESPPGIVRRSAITALSQLGIEYDPEQDAATDEDAAGDAAPASAVPPIDGGASDATPAGEDAASGEAVHRDEGAAADPADPTASDAW